MAAEERDGGSGNGYLDLGSDVLNFGGCRPWCGNGKGFDFFVRESFGGPSRLVEARFKRPDHLGQCAQAAVHFAVIRRDGLAELAQQEEIARATEDEDDGYQKDETGPAQIQDAGAFLQRNQSMLLLGAQLALAVERLQCEGQVAPCFTGLNDFVDEAAAGGNVGIGKGFAILFD